jgi:hypothetical protein
LRPQTPAFFFSLPFFLFVLKEASRRNNRRDAMLLKHATTSGAAETFHQSKYLG